MISFFNLFDCLSIMKRYALKFKWKYSTVASNVTNNTKSEEESWSWFGVDLIWRLVICMCVMPLLEWVSVCCLMKIKFSMRWWGPFCARPTCEVTYPRESEIIFFTFPSKFILFRWGLWSQPNLSRWVWEHAPTWTFWNI